MLVFGQVAGLVAWSYCLDKPQTPPPGTPVIELTEVVDSEEQAARPVPRPARQPDLGELDRILAELSSQEPPAAQEGDMAQLMAEMGLPPQPHEQAADPAEAELQGLLRELGSQGQALEAFEARAKAAAPPEGETPSPGEPEELADLVRLAVQRILQEEAPNLVSRLVAQELQERLESLVSQEIDRQIEAKVAREVQELLRRFMHEAGETSGRRDDGVVVD
jgi:hypothetical protein